ncbi:MAG: GntR family transcriptional regulator [Chloroflexi bacterium]|nr:GntR family transcriptional regulator [Chloroflexota bacterium]
MTANGASPSETAAEGYSRAGSKNATPLTAHYPLMDGRALGGRARPLPSLDGHPTIKDVIYHELRERIVVGELASGDRLVEADLAARFGVSKTPVREALLTLEAEGLIRLRPHRGAEVSRLSIEEWHDLIFLRDVLEIGALDDIVASMTEEHFAAAEQAVAAMEEAFKARDYRCYRQVQRRLHATILGAPGHPSLPEAAVRLNDRLDRYGWILTTRDPSRWAEDLAMNRRRLELIRAGDTATYAHMIRSRHAEASALVAQADALAEHRLEDVPGRSRRETGKE